MAENVRTMKNSLSIFVFLLIAGLGIAQDSEITLVSDVWPPFTNVSGEKSFANELVQEALKRQGVSSEIVIETFDNVLKDLEGKESYGSAALWKTEEREQFLVFSEPFLQNQLMLVSRVGVEVNNLTNEQLKGRRIGLVTGYAYNDSLTSDTNITLEYSETDQVNMEKLFSGKVDYVLVDNLVVNYMLNYELQNIKDLIVISKAPYDTKEMYFGLSKSTPNADQIIAGFNAEIKNLIADGTFHQTLGMQWIEADINGDGVTELVLNGDAAGEVSPEDAYALFHDGNPSSKEKGYYIDGSYYSTWDEVPARFKNNPRYTAPPENYSPGIRIKF